MKFRSLAAGGVVCYHNMPETFAGILTVLFFFSAMCKLENMGIFTLVTVMGCFSFVTFLIRAIDSAFVL